MEYLVVGFRAISETNTPNDRKIWDIFGPYLLEVLTFLPLKKMTKNNPECLLLDTTVKFSFPLKTGILIIASGKQYQPKDLSVQWLSG